MKIKEIIFHLNNVYEGRPWYGKSVVDIITKYYDGDPTVGRILAHMLAWRNFAEQKAGGHSFSIEIDSSADWPDHVPEGKDALSAFKVSNENLIEILTKKEDSWLREKVPDTSYNFQFLLEGIVQHDIYHLGQIAILHKMGTFTRLQHED